MLNSQRQIKMTVHFIGAGPGAPDLLTLRGRDLIAKCDLCLYAGSLVPDEILGHCPPHARKINTAPLSLEEIIKEINIMKPKSIMGFMSVIISDPKATIVVSVV